VSETLQAIISHRADGEPLTVDAGIIRVADALDMAKGRSRIPFEKGSLSMHSLSAAAIEDVTITDGEERPIKIEILMNNSSGIFQVDGLLKAKLRGSGPRAVRRGRRAHRHRDRAAPRADVPLEI
jgi:metal-dependent HD superfamily phosphatase/phosphodiesterase